MWLLPDGDDEQWESRSLRTLTKLKSDLPRHLSRKFHSQLASKYSEVDGLSASLRRDLLKIVCGDCSTGSHGKDDQQRDARLQLWLGCDLEDADDIIVDLRRLNKSDSHYDRFWGVMQSFLEDHEMKVNARRHGSTCETPICLVDQILDQRDSRICSPTYQI